MLTKYRYFPSGDQTGFQSSNVIRDLDGFGFCSRGGPDVALASLVFAPVGYSIAVRRPGGLHAVAFGDEPLVMRGERQQPIAGSGFERAM